MRTGVVTVDSVRPDLLSKHTAALICLSRCWCMSYSPYSATELILNHPRLHNPTSYVATARQHTGTSLGEHDCEPCSPLSGVNQTEMASTQQWCRRLGGAMSLRSDRQAFTSVTGSEGAGPSRVSVRCALLEAVHLDDVRRVEQAPGFAILAPVCESACTGAAVNVCTGSGQCVCAGN